MAVSTLVAVDPVRRRISGGHTRRVDGLASAPATIPSPRWALWSPGRTGTEWPRTSTSESERGRTSPLTAASTRCSAATPGGSGSGRCLTDVVAPGMSSTRRDLRAGSLVVRVVSLGRSSRPDHANGYGNGAAIFTSDGGRPGASRPRSRSGMVGINVAIPVPASTIRSAAGSAPCSVIPTRMGPTGCGSSPAPRS